MDNDDLLKFAEYLGMSGIDTDVFYESYYNLDNDSIERYYEDEYEVRWRKLHFLRDFHIDLLRHKNEDG